MRHPRLIGILVVVAAALSAAGCTTNKGKIEGTKWSSNAGTIRGQKIPAGKIELEFYKDGYFDFLAGPKIFTGKYSFGIGETVVLNFDQELIGRKTHAEQIHVQDGELTMTDSDGTKLVFSRVR